MIYRPLQQCEVCGASSIRIELLMDSQGWICADPGACNKRVYHPMNDLRKDEIVDWFGSSMKLP